MCIKTVCKDYDECMRTQTDVKKCNPTLGGCNCLARGWEWMRNVFRYGFI